MTPQMGSPKAARVLPDGKTLSLRGNVVDHIALVSDVFPPYSLTSQNQWHNDVHMLLVTWKTACTSGGLESTFEEGLEYILYSHVKVEASVRARLRKTTGSEGVGISVRVLFDQRLYTVC